MDEFAEVAEPYGTFLENLTELMPSFILALVILALFTYGGWKFSHWVTHGFRGGKSSIQRVFYRRVIFGIVFFFGLIMVLPVFGYTQIATFFLAGGSLMAVIFGIAFREIGQNILGGFLLAINRPFEIGDLVAVGDFEGTVITLNLRNTHLRSYEGEDIFIPNTDFMQKPLVNYTRDGLRRFEFEVGIEYSNDAQKAREAILEALHSVDHVLDDPSPEAMVNELGASAVVLRCFYWVNMYVMDPSLQEIRTTVINTTKEKLMEQGFELPGDILEIKNHGPSGPVQLDVEPSAEPSSVDS